MTTHLTSSDSLATSPFGELEGDGIVGHVGTVSLEQTGPVVAGEHSTWTFRYVTGPFGVDDGGGLKFIFPIPSDRGTPQFTDPAAPDYATIRTTGAATVTARYALKLHVRPWVKGVMVDISDGALAPGDVVELVLGETAGGSVGARAQSYAEELSRTRVMVDTFATNVFYDVPGETSHPVRAGAAERLIAIAPSEVHAGETMRVTVRAVDRFGNLATTYAGTLELRAEDTVMSQGRASAGLFETILAAPRSGSARISVHDIDNDWSTETNPVNVISETKHERLFWGDTQGQTGETVGSGSLDEFFDYARDIARLDFVTHSANDFQVENASYAETLAATDRHTRDGEFVAFGGFEWSGNTPVGGDHNVLFADNTDAPLLRSSHALVEDTSDVGTDRQTVALLNQTLRDESINAICVAHVGGRVADLDLVETSTTPALEIVSVHGWFEWFALEALKKGLRVGFLGASDDHTGRPGASFPSLPLFGVRSGLAGVRATELSRSGILEGIRSRHCYATTGERILLDVSSGSHVMGDAWRHNGTIDIDVEARGTAGIEAIDLMGPDGVIETWRPACTESATRLRVSWRGARSRFRSRVQPWNGSLQIDGAAISNAVTWSFDHPDQGITELSSDSLSWTSTTNGDHDGVILDLDGSATAMHFSAGGTDIELNLTTLPRGGLEIPIENGLDRAVCVQWLPLEEPPMDAKARFTMPAADGGTRAVFVRVRQSDGHLAWSSPMFIDSAE